MIVIIEPYWRGLSHATSNASLVHVARAAYPDEVIVVMAEFNHLDAIMREIERVPNVRGQAIDVPQEVTHPLGRALADWRNIGTAFTLLQGQSTRVLILASAEDAVLTTCTISARLNRSRGTRMLARLHGNLNSILRGRRRNPFRQFLHLGSVLTRARNAGIGLIVLEESIRTELLALRPDFARDVFVLEEAVTNEDAVADCPTPGQPVRFAFLGVGTRAKGIEQFLSAASEVRAAAAGKAEFEIIGKLHHLAADLPVDALARPPATEPLSRDEYVRRLRRQHYVCAFYEPNYYRFSASGVLVDAMALGKPVIVTQVPFAGDLFARFGDVGDLCRTRAEIVRAMMQAALAPDTERYRSQVRNLALAAKARHVSALAPRMRSIVESVSNGA